MYMLGKTNDASRSTTTFLSTLASTPYDGMAETSSGMAPMFSSSSLGNVTSDAWDANVTQEPYIRPFDDNGIIASAVIIFTFMVIGLTLNILTIIVITTNSKLKNIFMHFIVSLCVSDLISALISWLFLYRRTWGFDQWSPLPQVFCRFYWAADLMTNYVTALHILSFAILRYISIQFPVRFSKLTLRHGRIWMAVIWLTCFLCGFIPYFILFDARYRDRMSASPDARWPSCTVVMETYDAYILYAQIGYSLFLYAPTVGVVLTSVLIGATVRRRLSATTSSRNPERQARKERQAVLQLSLIVLSFLIGYVPFTAYEFWSVQPRPNTMYYKRFDYWFGMSEYFVLRFSECLNPVFYNLGSAKMRKCTWRYLASHFSCQSGCRNRCACGKGAGAVRSTPPSSSPGGTKDYGV